MCYIIIEYSIYENNIDDYLPSDYACTPESQYISPYSIRVINASRAYEYNLYRIELALVHQLEEERLKDNH